MAEFFTPGSQQRISKVVRTVEGMARDLVPKPGETKLPLPYQIRRFELAEALAPTAPGDPIAKVWAYILDQTNRIGPELGPGEDNPGMIELIDPTNSRTGIAYDATTSPDTRGSRGTCYHPHDVDRWEIIDMYTTPPGNLVRFELKYALVPGGTAMANFLSSTGVVDAGLEFAVTDFLGTHRGRAAGEFAAPHHRGSQGYAVWMPDGGTAGRFELTDMTPHALEIKGSLEGTLVKDTATFLISGVTVRQPIGGIITDTDPAANITVQNRAFDGDNQSVVYATWDEAEADWYALDVLCPV